MGEKEFKLTLVILGFKEESRIASYLNFKYTYKKIIIYSYDDGDIFIYVAHFNSIKISPINLSITPNYKQAINKLKELLCK